MNRRSRINGTVRPFGEGKWLIRMSAGKDLLTGKRRQPSLIVTGTRSDAERVLLEMQHNSVSQRHEGVSMTLDELFEMWITSPTKGGRQRSATTRYHESGRYRRYIHPSLGATQISLLRASDLSLFYDALLTKTFPGQSKPIGPRSVAHINSLLRAMLNWAWRRDFIRENPALKADCPSVPLQPLVAPERSLVANHLEVLWSSESDLALAVWLAATLGLRRSEIVALRWSDVLFSTSQIAIRSGVVKVPGSSFQMTNTKTGLHGHAVFPLHGVTFETLSTRFQIFRKQIMSQQVTTIEDGYIFSSDPLSAVPTHPDALSKQLRKHCKQHPALEAITLQSLRKYAASDLAGTGVDETTASALLRNRPETARRHYQAAYRHNVRQEALGIANRLVEEVA